MGRLGDDSLQVPLAYRLKQIDSTARQVIHKQHRGLHDLFEQTLPLDQRQTPQILAILPQLIERIEVLGRPPAHQIVKPRATILAQVDDLAIQDYLARQGLADGGRQLRERLEFVVIAGNEAAAAAGYMRERAEAVVFQLEDKV